MLVKKMNPVFEIMDMISAPIITFSQSWADAIPKKLIDAIKLSRLTAQALKLETATDPEIVAYIMTATLESPMQGDWVDIYLHYSCKVCQEYWNEDHWEDVMAPRALSEYQQYQAKKLSNWIYRQRRTTLSKRLKEPEFKFTSIKSR